MDETPSGWSLLPDSVSDTQFPPAKQTKQEQKNNEARLPGKLNEQRRR
jgi:hypothetical protein